MKIQTKNYSFVSKFDEVPIHGICLVPERPIGILQMVHGMCEHKERYLPFMENMAKRGYITLMHDNRGHGKSVKADEDIGYFYDSMENGFVGDIHKVTQQIRREYPGLPLILYGHSMGSLAARVYLRNHDDEIDGLIISGCPSYNELVPIALRLIRMLKKRKGEHYRSKLAQKMVLGSFENRFRREHRKHAWLAAKESVAEEFDKDELCTFTYTLNGFETLLDLEYITYKAIGYQMENEDLPILFVSGADDPCYVNEKKWKQAISRLLELGYHDVQEIRYDNMRHEIHNEVDNELVFDDLDKFCRKVMEGVKNDKMNRNHSI